MSLWLIVGTQDFLGILSKVSRGSVQEKLQWIFGLYDLNGDGLISKSEMLDVVTSIYDMMGRSTDPVVEENSAKEHVEKIFHNKATRVAMTTSRATVVVVAMTTCGEEEGCVFSKSVKKYLVPGAVIPTSYENTPSPLQPLAP
uniref:EF-hand domain-containing protein n=1 Tax=Timema poppense TaxID=170557 RepID=A0A7R9H932_TIMPO|nr:unnamed protein product [Timema poppensis]